MLVYGEVIFTAVTILYNHLTMLHAALSLHGTPVPGAPQPVLDVYPLLPLVGLSTRLAGISGRGTRASLWRCLGAWSMAVIDDILENCFLVISPM